MPHQSFDGWSLDMPLLSRPIVARRDGRVSELAPGRSETHRIVTGLLVEEIARLERLQAQWSMPGRARELEHVKAALAQIDPMPLDQPDAPGWWAFEGSERKTKLVPCSEDEADLVDEGEWDEGDEPDVRYFKRVDGLDEPFQTILFVRHVKKGERFSSRYQDASYDGPQGVLGYIMTHHPWYNGMNGLDKLAGKWTRVFVPWEADDGS